MSYTAGTYTIKPKEIQKEWFVIDATDLIPGRLGAEVTKILRGKHKPTYTANMDMGDNVVIINAEKIHFTGKKLDGLVLNWHTGYPGGLKSRTARERLGSDHPERVLLKVIERMMPKDSPLARKQMKNLYVYAGGTHEQEAQQPKVLDLGKRNKKNKKGN